MSHRPGHIEDSGSGTFSMSRRNYLKTLTATAAIAGTAGAIISACTSTPKEGEQSEKPAATPGQSTAPQWGILTVYPKEIITIEEANRNPLQAGSEYIQIPFFNTFNLDIQEGMNVGFQLLTIGCNGVSAIAINLVDHDHEPDTSVDWAKRNESMDAKLASIGFTPKPWPPAPC